MRRRALAAAALAWLAMGAAPLAAQEEDEPAAEIARRHFALEDEFRANPSAVTVRRLNELSPKIHATGDLQLLARSHELWAKVAARDGDEQRQIGGRFNAVLAREMSDGPLAEITAIAHFNLAQVYVRNVNFQNAAQQTLANVLSTAILAEAKGADMTDIRAMAHALMAQSLINGKRPHAALHHVRAAQARAERAGFSQGNMRGLATLEAMAREAIADAPAPPPPETCGPDALAQTERRDACRLLADTLLGADDVSGAERVLARLTERTKAGALSANEFPPVRDLWLVRMLTRPPTDAAMIETSFALASWLAASVSPGEAAIVAMRPLRAALEAKVWDPRLARLGAHVARRLLRMGDDGPMMRFLETLVAYNAVGLPSANGLLDVSTRENRRRVLTRALIALDIAYFAERNGWKTIAARYLALGVARAKAWDLGAMEELVDDLNEWFSKDSGFIFPTPAAAMEFYARVARRAPKDDEHRRRTLILWPSLEQVYRGDDARAARVAEATVAELRADPKGQETVLADLLTLYAGFLESSDPARAERLRREALDLFVTQPDTESDRLDVLMTMASDRKGLGDALGAERLMAEAAALRAHPKIAPRLAARFDMQAAVDAFNKGERDSAVTQGEKAFDILLRATEKAQWSRVSMAKRMAAIYAAAGRPADARRVYEAHVFPHTDDVLASGEVAAVDARLDLASLEALHGPTQDTVKLLNDLLVRARRTAGLARDLQATAWRSLAIAHLGLGEGLAALDAARRALSLKPPARNDQESEAEDRRLLETIVGAAWSASS